MWSRPSWSALLERIGSARVVLLGEATHGTHEFYRMRARISRALIERHGFRAVAVEADWPDAARVDRYVRHLPPASVPWKPFSRFPTWMWRNEEVRRFAEWLRVHNGRVEPERRAGFHGLDLYSLFTSADAVLRYLEQVDPEAGRVARARYGLLTPWQTDPAAYGRAVVSGQFESREAEVVQVLVESPEEAAGVRERATASASSTPAERPRGGGRRGLLPGDVPGERRVLEPARPAHGRDAAVAARLSRPGEPGGGLGPQLPRRRRPGDRDGRHG